MGFFLLLLPTAALADNLSWTLAAGVGAFNYAGNPPPTGKNTYLYGTNIGVASVQNLTNHTNVNISNGFLSFQSGAVGSPWSWGAGGLGTLTLTGCINGTCGLTLLKDEFTSAELHLFSSTYQVTLGNIIGTLDPTLASALGVLTSVSGTFNSNVDIGSTPFGAAFSNLTNLGGTITTAATSAPSSVPEPSSLLLILSGLAAVALLSIKQDKLLKQG
jgi:hypothetical protein